MFASCPRADEPVIVAGAVWQYSHHVLPGFARHHAGPILTVANWSGQGPGLVGMLTQRLRSRRRASRYDTIWSETFDDSVLPRGRSAPGSREGRIEPRRRARAPVRHRRRPSPAEQNASWASGSPRRRVTRMAILGVFDEGCMGMYNAIVDDELLNPMGIFKERLSQSALVVGDAARWVTTKSRTVRRLARLIGGMTFPIRDPTRPRTSRTGQIVETVQDVRRRRADGSPVRLRRHRHPVPAGAQGHDARQRPGGGPAQQRGASARAKTPRAADRSCSPARRSPTSTRSTKGAAVDALVTHRVWTNSLASTPPTTLHDLRWGEWFEGDGDGKHLTTSCGCSRSPARCPASHLEGGYRGGAEGHRQPPMYFPLGRQHAVGRGPSRARSCGAVCT